LPIPASAAVFSLVIDLAGNQDAGRAVGIVGQFQAMAAGAGDQEEIVALDGERCLVARRDVVFAALGEVEIGKALAQRGGTAVEQGGFADPGGGWSG
jgi:hypothetical protein